MAIITGNKPFVVLPDSWESAGGYVLGHEILVYNEQLSPPATPLHHFDLTDTSTLFTDDEGTLPALNEGDRVAHVTNKGSSTEFLNTSEAGAPFIATTASAAPKTMPSVGSGSVVSAPYFAADEHIHVLTASAGAIDDVPTTIEHYSFACIHAVEADEAGTNGIFTWGNSPGTETVMVTQNGASSAITMGAGAELNSVAEIDSPQDTWMAQIATYDDEATPTSSMWASPYRQNPATTTDVLTPATGPQAEDSMAIGVYSSGATNNMLGWVGEILVWDRILTTDEVRLFIDYANTKYGITWGSLGL